MMNNYKRVLTQLDSRNTLFYKVKKRAVILTGQSDFVHSELSAQQLKILSLFETLGYESVKTGFPFNKQHDFAGCRRAGLIKASVRNIMQYCYSIMDAEYIKLLAKHLTPMFLGAEDIIIVCQSSGLNMLKAALPFIEPDADARITVFALGPVVWGRFYDKRIKVVVIKGYWDFISILLDWQSVDFWVDCHHLNYCTLAKLPRLVRGVISSED